MPGITYYIPTLLEGLIYTFKALLLSIPGSIVVGLGVGIFDVYGLKVVNLVSKAYRVFFRGLPFLVLLMLLYFGLPQIGIILSSYWAFVIGWWLCSGAYQAEYVRGAIRSIGEGQTMAAKSIGMSKFREVFHIIIPQAFRRALPGITNEIIYGIKISALAYVVAYPEIFYHAKALNMYVAEPIAIYGGVAIIFIALTFVAQLLLNRLEVRLRIPGEVK